VNKPPDNEQLAAMLHIALRVVNQRVLTLIALLLNAGMFAWAMWAGDYPRLAIAATFAAGTWVLIHFRREA
jgi:hypothetical protein